MKKTTTGVAVTAFESREIFGAEIQYYRTEPRYWDLMFRKFADTDV